MLEYCNVFRLKSGGSSASLRLEEVWEVCKSWFESRLKQRLGLEEMRKTPQLEACDARLEFVEVEGRVGVMMTEKEKKVELTLRQEESGVTVSVWSELWGNLEREVGKPEVVRLLVENFSLSGARGSSLTVFSKKDLAFLVGLRERLEDPTREHPVLLVSYFSGRRDYFVSPERLAEACRGDAEVIAFSPDLKNVLACQILGKDWTPYNGGLHISYPKIGKQLHGQEYRLLPRQMENVGEGQAEPERVKAEYVAGMVFREMNHSHFLRHLSMAELKEMKLRQRLGEVQALEELARLREENRILSGLLEVAEGERDRAKGRAERAEEEKSNLSQENFSLRERNTVLEEALESKKGQKSSIGEEEKDLVERAIRGENLSPEECLKAVYLLRGSERLEILPSAWKSSKKAEGFQYGQNLLVALLNLTGTYLYSLRDGETDRKAGKCFGREVYSPKESRQDRKGRSGKARTFSVDGEEVLMEQHLKLGSGKASEAETLRVHFAVIDGRVVIGHCGQHLCLAKMGGGR